MNATEQRYYDKQRKQGVSARSALAYARYMTADDVFNWDTDPQGNDRGKLTRDGFDLVATVTPGYEDDLSWIGSFSSTRTPDAIKSERHHAPMAFQTEEWFVPAITAREHRDGLVKLGYSHAVAYDLAQEYVRRDMRSLFDTREYDVTVTAYRNGIELGSASLGGVDFADDYTEARRYADTLAVDLADEAIKEAREALAGLCS